MDKYEKAKNYLQAQKTIFASTMAPEMMLSLMVAIEAIDKIINVKEQAVDESFLSDWYINSVDNSKEPVWTDPHIEELLNDFMVIPKKVVKDEL